MAGGRRRASCALLVLALVAGPRAWAADLLDAAPPGARSPRFFPREDGEALDRQSPPPPRGVATCAPRKAAVPTDDPDDPSYVGSAYGLGKPSYYGLRPALGHDDPFGRPLRYCP